MAEGWCNHLFTGKIQGYSAGVKAQGLNPNAVEVMAEAGVDISNQKSELLDQFTSQSFDLVLTVCDNAANNCPIFHGATKTVHHSFDDPPALAKAETDAELKLNHYRRVRDEIGDYVKALGEDLLA